ncbi:hypothetical protein BDZ89DRAFT_1111410 [Hymenopellis radicata]|nr:hypothetical protein BDZ89DRAFT_1111410 [Hymenopellis radicata]
MSPRLSPPTTMSMEIRTALPSHRVPTIFMRRPNWPMIIQLSRLEVLDITKRYTHLTRSSRIQAIVVEQSELDQRLAHAVEEAAKAKEAAELTLGVKVVVPEDAEAADEEESREWQDCRRTYLSIAKVCEKKVNMIVDSWIDLKGRISYVLDQEVEGADGGGRGSRGMAAGIELCAIAIGGESIITMILQGKRIQCKHLRVKMNMPAWIITTGTTSEAASDKSGKREDGRPR